MDYTKKVIFECFQLIQVVTFPVQPEDDQQFQAPDYRISATKSSDSQPVSHVPSDRNDPSTPIDFDRGSKESESFDSHEFPLKGLSAYMSDTGLYGSHRPLTNEVLGRKQADEQKIMLNEASDSFKYMTQQIQTFDQRAQPECRASSSQVGNYIGDYIQGSCVTRDREQFYDAVIAYDQSDFTEVQLFKEELTQMMANEGFPDLRLELFDSTVFPASYIMSIEDIVRRSSLVLVYLTPQFNPNKLELFCNEIIGLTRLGYNETDIMAGRLENTQKWVFRPVHTQPERGRYYKTPIGLTTVIGLNWYDRYSPNTRMKIVSVMAQALNGRVQREKHAHFTSSYRELSKQYRNSDYGKPHANESLRLGFNHGVPSQIIRPQYENLYNAQSGTGMNFSHGVRTPVDQIFYQTQHVVRQSTPRTQILNQINGRVPQIVNMTRFQRPQLSMIPEQTLEHSGSFKSGQELHTHISILPSNGTQHHNSGQHSYSMASVDALSIRSQDAHNVPWQHHLLTTRPQSTMSFAQSASLSAEHLKRNGHPGNYCDSDHLSGRNNSYRQAPQNIGSNIMPNEMLTGFTDQGRSQLGRNIPQFPTSNQCFSHSDSEVLFKDMKAYQNTECEYNRLGVDVVTGKPFQTARIDPGIENRLFTRGNTVIQSASLSSQAASTDTTDHPRLLPQGMQRNVQAASSPWKPQMSYPNMTSVSYSSMEGPQRLSPMIISKSQAQIHDNFSQPSVSYPLSECQNDKLVQIHSYQQYANPSFTPMMQMNVHQTPSVNIPSSNIQTQEPFCGHPDQHIFNISSSPSMQTSSQMPYAGIPSFRLDQPQSSLGNEQLNQIIGRPVANNLNYMSCDSDRYTNLPNNSPSINIQRTQINASGPEAVNSYKPYDMAESSNHSAGLEQSIHNFKPFNNKNNDEIDLNPDLSNDDLEIDKIHTDSGTFHKTTMKEQVNINPSETHDKANSSRKMKQNDKSEEDDLIGERLFNRHYHGNDVREGLHPTDRVVKNVTNILGSKNVQFGANSKVITYKSLGRRSRQDRFSSDESSSSDEENTRKPEIRNSRSSRSSASVTSLNIYTSQASTHPTMQDTLLQHQSSSEEDNCAQCNLHSGITNNLDSTPMGKQPKDKRKNVQNVTNVNTETAMEKTKSKLTVDANDISNLSGSTITSGSLSNGSINASQDGLSVSGKYFGINGRLMPIFFKQMVDRDNPRVMETNISEVD